MLKFTQEFVFEIHPGITLGVSPERTTRISPQFFQKLFQGFLWKFFRYSIRSFIWVFWKSFFWHPFREFLPRWSRQDKKTQVLLGFTLEFFRNSFGNSSLRFQQKFFLGKKNLSINTVLESFKSFNWILSWIDCRNALGLFLLIIPQEFLMGIFPEFLLRLSFTKPDFLLETL